MGELRERDVDRELDLFIERRGRDLRSSEAGDEEYAPRWQSSCEEYAGKLRELNRSAWRTHHLHLAHLHARLAEEHRTEAEKLTGRRESR